MAQRVGLALSAVIVVFAALGVSLAQETRDIHPANPPPIAHATSDVALSATHPAPHEPDYWSSLFVFVLSTFIGLGVILRVSRLLHTPLMSLTNAISAIAVVGAIIVAGADYPTPIRFLGAVALVASVTNIVSGFLITDRMLKMFKQPARTGGNR